MRRAGRGVGGRGVPAAVPAPVADLGGDAHEVARPLQAMTCSPHPTWSRPAPSRSTRRPAPSGPGWCRWEATGEAPTPTTGSRTSSASTCTAPARCCRSSRTSRPATPSHSGRTAHSSTSKSSIRTLTRLSLRRCKLDMELQPGPENGSTRLVSRNRIATPNASLAKRAVNALLMEPGSLVMERKMLKGIRQRAEKLAHKADVGVAEG